MKHKHYLISLLMGSALILQPEMTLAQVDELLVTARKREESLLDVPVSVTAFTAESLSRRRITELEDIALQTPGFTFEDFSNGGFGVPVVRGTTQQDITILEQNVSTFLDGIYIPRAYVTDIGIVNLDRIEVVKGPQSAIYGQNAFMGAINYVPRKPGDEFEVDGSVTIGSDELIEGDGSVSIPVIPDILSVRAAFAYSEFDGTWENNHPNAGLDISPGMEDNFGGWKKSFYSGAVRFTPVDRLEIKLSYYNFENETEPVAQFRIDSRFGDTNCSNDGFFCGTFPTPDESELVIDPRSQGLNLQTQIYRAGIDIDVTESISASYLYGKIESEVFSIGGADRFPLMTFANLFLGTPTGELDYDSHEIRVDYESNGPFRATIGGFLSFGEDLDQFSFGFLPLLGTDAVFPTNPDLFLISETMTKTDVSAVFFSATYDLLSDRARLSFEGRYTNEEKSINDGRSETFTYFTPRLTAEWDITEDTLLYFSAARGVKAGGFNSPPTLFMGAPLVAGEDTFDPDTNWTYEIGTKASWLDDRLQLSGAVFYIDWSQLQISSRPTTPDELIGIITPDTPIPGIVLNLGDATVLGFELEGVLSVTDQLTANFGISHAKAEYNDGTISQRLDRRGACDGIVCDPNGDIGGNSLARSSPTQFNAGAIWEDDLPLFSDLRYYLRGDLTWQSKQFATEANVAEIPSRTLVNLTGAITHERWELQLWAKNVFNEEYVANSFATITTATVYTPALGRQRTFGATFSVNF